MLQSRVLIVAGMHRSGTSLITNWLYHCGLQVGESLVGANEGNKEGHYEDVEFLKIHEEILAENSLPPSGLIHHRHINITAYQLEKVKAVIKVKNQYFQQWGWKEPRTCLFLDLYRELLPQAKYLVIVRDYLSVVNSLLKRDFDLIDSRYNSRSFFTRLSWRWYRKNNKRKEFYRNKAGDYLNVWMDYNRHILDMLSHLPPKDYLVINYSLLEKNDREVFTFLTKCWNFELGYYPFNKVYNKSLISPQTDLGPFINDTELVSRAKALESEFNKYMQIV
jgi:hypothetical protein